MFLNRDQNGNTVFRVFIRKVTLCATAVGIAVTSAVIVSTGQTWADPGVCTAKRDTSDLDGHSPHGGQQTYGWYMTWANCDGSGTDWVKIKVLLGTDSPCYGVKPGMARTVDYHPRGVFSHSAKIQRCF